MLAKTRKGQGESSLTGDARPATTGLEGKRDQQTLDGPDNTTQETLHITTSNGIRTGGHTDGRAARLGDSLASSMIREIGLQPQASQSTDPQAIQTIQTLNNYKQLY